MTFYDDLGVAALATSKEIKEAYHKLARLHHPDRGGDNTTFKRISEAYETLSDPTRRMIYDSRPRPQLPERIVPIPAKTLHQGGVVELVHATPCDCQCYCLLMGKVYVREGLYRRVRFCNVGCHRCATKVIVPPRTIPGTRFGDNGYVQFIASVTPSSYELKDGRLRTSFTAPLFEVLTGFSRTIDGQTMTFAREVLATSPAVLKVVIDDIEYKIKVTF
jgi:curved DNA-binding protein CbpA